jgi:LysM repeat protein
LGYTTNMDETLDKLAADPGAVLASGVLRVTIQPVIPNVMEAGEALAEAQRLLDSPVSIQAYDPISDEHLSWQAPRQAVASWLQVTPGQDGPQVTFDPAGIAAYLEALSQELGPQRYLEGENSSVQLATDLPQGSSPTLIVKHTPTTYVVQANDTLLKIGWKLGMPYWMILEANPGIDPDALPVGAELVVPSKDKLLPLPVVTNKRIVLSISKQHMWVYKDGAMIRDFVISTGIDRSPTQPGVFQVQTHESNAYASVWDLYMPNFLGVYEAWPGFMNGIHGLPTLSSGRRLWANILGSPASYGCIILDLGPSEWLYSWAENGVVVEIQP